MNQRASRSSETKQPTVTDQPGSEALMAEKEEPKEKGCASLRRRSHAYLEYENLAELPQNAPLAELDENGYPILHMGERFCRLSDKGGNRICGLRFRGANYVALLTKHFSDAHEIDADKKPPFQRGGKKKNEEIDREIAWYENFMQSIGFSPKRKADSVASEEIVTPPKSKKQKQKQTALPAATQSEQLPSGPSVSALSALPTAGSSPEKLPQPAKTPVPGTSVFPAAPQAQQLLSGPVPPAVPASSALPAAQQRNQLPSASPSTLTPGPVAIVAGSAPQVPATEPPSLTSKPVAIPQDQYTQTYIASYNNGWNDCEREYQQRVAELEAEKTAFEREKAQFHALRTRFGGELKELLREVEGNR